MPIPEPQILSPEPSPLAQQWHDVATNVIPRANLLLKLNQEYVTASKTQKIEIALKLETIWREIEK